MAENTKIEWATHSWSPWRGCAKVSPGCTNCYAEKLSHRNPAVLGEWGVNGNRVINADWTKPLAWDRKAAKLGERHRVFPSLCDPFEDREDLDASRIRLLELIIKTPNLDWLLLTKRPENWLPLMHRISDKWGTAGGHIAGRWLDNDAIPNIWIGTSVENQEYADERLPVLAEIPASIRWVSYEPALGLVDFTGGPEAKCRDCHGTGVSDDPISGRVDCCCIGENHLNVIDWIVCGGESGPGSRPFDLRWAESVRDQCKANGTAFFMKQVGSRPVMSSGETNPIKRAVCEKHNAGWIGRHITDPKGGKLSEWPEDLRVREFPFQKEASRG